MRKLVRLWDCPGLILIVESDTSVTYTNQVCGNCCMEHELQGAAISFGTEFSRRIDEISQPYDPEQALLEYFTGPKYGGSGAMLGLDQEDAAKITDVLRIAGLDDLIEVDISRLKDSVEAWVWVIVKKNGATFNGFGPYPCNGVLTWTNSD